MKKSNLRSFGFVLVLMILIVACNGLPGEGTTVRMGQGTWDTGWFQAQVYKALLEELGYEMRGPENVDSVAFYLFSAQGDLDFWANGWFPLHSSYLDIENVTGKVEPVGFQVKGGALQGYMIDKATAEKLGITNLGDLQDPELAAVFDVDGDGIADLIGCDEGWTCASVIEHQIDKFELSDTVTQVQGNYSQLMSDVVTRYEQNQSVLFYTWTPNWTVSALDIGEDVMWLGVPFSAVPDDPDADTEAATIAGCLETPCDMGFVANDIRVVANSEFLTQNPAAAVLFEAVELPLADIAAQNVRMSAGENSEEDVRRHADEWIEANRELVDQWLEAARAAAK